MHLLPQPAFWLKPTAMILWWPSTKNIPNTTGLKTKAMQPKSTSLRLTNTALVGTTAGRSGLIIARRICSRNQLPAWKISPLIRLTRLKFLGKNPLSPTLLRLSTKPMQRFPVYLLSILQLHYKMFCRKKWLKVNEAPR